jgi:hypothetical protein
MRNAPPSGLMDNTREVAEFRPGQFVTGYGLDEKKEYLNRASLLKENAKLQKLYDLCMRGSEIEKMKKPRTAKAESRLRDNEKVASMAASMRRAADLKEMKKSLKTNRQKRAIVGERAYVETMAQKMQRLRDIKKMKKAAESTADKDHYDPSRYDSYTGEPDTFDYYDSTTTFQYPYTSPTKGGCMRRH